MRKLCRNYPLASYPSEGSVSPLFQPLFVVKDLWFCVPEGSFPQATENICHHPESKKIKYLEGSSGTIHTSISISRFGIFPAWEEESPGRNPKSLKKVSKKSSDPRATKSEKSLGESPKSLGESPKTGFSRLFGLSPRLFSDFWGPRVQGLFRDFFQTFGVSARRLLLPGREDPKSRYGNAGITSKAMSTTAILWPVKAIFEKAATVEADTFISAVPIRHTQRAPGLK